MAITKERYVVDEQGNRVAVLLDIAECERVLQELEELESLRAYDGAKASGDEGVPFEQAVAEIECDRQPGGAPARSAEDQRYSSSEISSGGISPTRPSRQMKTGSPSRLWRRTASRTAWLSAR